MTCKKTVVRILSCLMLDCYTRKWCSSCWSCCCKFKIHTKSHRTCPSLAFGMHLRQIDLIDFYQHSAKWRASMEQQNPQFQFWSKTLTMKLDYLFFLGSIRSAKFNLYVASIEKFLPWILAFDHIYYARWLTVHHNDMESLRQNNSSIYPEFERNGSFVVCRTRNPFSAMAMD